MKPIRFDLNPEHKLLMCTNINCNFPFDHENFDSYLQEDEESSPEIIDLSSPVKHATSSETKREEHDIDFTDVIKQFIN